MPPVTHLPPFPWFDVVVILMLIALNGVFAMAEMAIVSSRKPRLKARFTTAPDGRFAFRTIMPGQYPRSGPPAHIHLEVTPPGKPMEPFELVFEGDSRMTDAIRADAKVGKFYTLCTPATGAGGVKQCRDVTFRVH